MANQTETLTDLHFPKAGVDLSQPHYRQPNRPAAGGVWARTTPVGVNVRTFEPATDRSRGGARTGISRYIGTQVAGSRFIVQDLNIFTTTTGGGVVQTSQSGRVVTLVAVSQGNVYSANPGDTTWTATTNSSGESPPLNFTGLVRSAPNSQKLYFVDGTNYRYYNPFNNTVYTWTSSAGTMPRDSAGNRARLIANWRGRIVLSGVLLDPQNWFMSAVADPHDFDYGPLSPTPTQAVAGNNAPFGEIGDMITGLVPYTDDVMLFGGDHTIWIMRGDPMDGGRVDLVSDIIGMAWGEAWTKDPNGTIWFVSNRCDVYTIVPGQQPKFVSNPVRKLMSQVNTGTHGIRLLWDDRLANLHVFVTKLTESDAATHFVFESRTGAWWVDEYAEDDFNPLCCVNLDGNEPGDRVSLIGSWDGYVRALDPDAVDDDGEDIASEVWIGPLLTPTTDEMMLREVQGVLAAGSGDVGWNVHVGRTAEEALDSTAVASGTFTSGRGVTFPVRRAAHAIYVKLTSTVPWAMEQIRARLTTHGKVRRRNR
jgi:hypothetical protein